MAAFAKGGAVSRLVLAAVAALVVAVSAGCGSAQLDVTTTVLSPDRVEHRIDLRAQGALGAALSERLQGSDLEQDGWDVEVTREGQTLHVAMTRTSDLEEAFALPGGMGAVGSPSGSVEVDGGLLGRDYRVVVSLPAAGPRDLQGNIGAGEEQLRQVERLVAQMLTLTWTINLPGQVTETNADRRTANGGSWDLTFDRLRSGMELRIASREGPAPEALAGGALGLALAAALGWFAYRSGRRHGAGLDQPPPAAPDDPAAVDGAPRLP